LYLYRILYNFIKTMNEYTEPKTKFINLFAIGCILIVCFFGINLSKQTKYIKPVSVWTKIADNKTWEQNTWWQRSITVASKAMKPWTNKDSQKNDNTKRKPIWTGKSIITKIFIKDWKLAYTKVEAVVNSGAITKHILWACIKTRNQPHCVNTILWVSKAESSIFRNCYMWSCLGIKPKGNIKTYENVKYCIDDWVERYNKYWYNNKNADDMLRRSSYCDGECKQKGSNWRLSFDSFIWYIK
jgi:hypothetical protein